MTTAGRILGGREWLSMSKLQAAAEDSRRRGRVSATAATAATADPIALVKSVADVRTTTTA